MASSGKSARKKGHSFEREICKLLVARGFVAVTSRSESKRLDDAGCDIFSDFPFYIQAKAVERMSMPVHEMLKTMSKSLPDRPPCVFHKRNNKNTVVSLQLNDFLDLCTIILKKH